LIILGVVVFFFAETRMKFLSFLAEAGMEFPLLIVELMPGNKNNQLLT